ncbi:hypothetical protein WJT86_03390 [Microvirga sp. W0021]|uniref:Lipoprotein n=1 Tax=Hohaiivirga grylli TaxID=3133970 RepID=A0ABV0BGR0_9HYPH
MSLLKVFAPAALALLAAGCQTTNGPVNITQEVYGNVQPAVSDNWRAVVSRGGSIAYICPASRCREPGAIGYSVARVNADAEYLVREKVVSSELVQEIGDTVSDMTDGQYRQLNVRNLTNKEAAGFETVSSYTGRKGKYYSVSRVGINGNEVRMITGMGKSLQTARKNLRIGLDGAK